LVKTVLLTKTEPLWRQHMMCCVQLAAALRAISAIRIIIGRRPFQKAAWWLKDNRLGLVHGFIRVMNSVLWELWDPQRRSDSHCRLN
jgi:hypothetical protein